MELIEKEVNNSRRGFHSAFQEQIQQYLSSCMDACGHVVNGHRN